MIDYFTGMFRYDSEANRQVLMLLKNLPALDDRTKRIFIHIPASKKIWMERLNRNSPGLTAWPDMTLNECESLIQKNRESCESYFRGKTERDLEIKIHYQNSKGVNFATAVKDILSHVLIHGGYHRGQVARALREAGVDPVNTDYITYVRNLH